MPDANSSIGYTEGGSGANPYEPDETQQLYPDFVPAAGPTVHTEQATPQNRKGSRTDILEVVTAESIGSDCTLQTFTLNTDGTHQIKFGSGYVDPMPLALRSGKVLRRRVWMPNLGVTSPLVGVLVSREGQPAPGNGVIVWQGGTPIDFSDGDLYISVAALAAMGAAGVSFANVNGIICVQSFMYTPYNGDGMGGPVG